MKKVEYGAHCLCEQSGYEFRGPVLWSGLCFCDSCRRQTASPYTAFIGVPDGAWRWIGSPRIYHSSPGVRRYFCPSCGAPIAFQSDRFPGEIHFFTALLDDPNAFPPDAVYHGGEHLSWAPVPPDLLDR